MMTPTSLLRPVSLTVGDPSVVTALLLGAGAVTVLAGGPAWSLVPIGVLMLWGVREAGSAAQVRRSRGHASTLVGLAFALAVSLPVVFEPALDELALAVLIALPLVGTVVSAPDVRAALRLRAVTQEDLSWLVGALVLAIVVGLVVRPTATHVSALGLAAIAALSLLVPVLHEVIFRGLMMPTSASVRSVALPALAQGCTSAALFGWWGLAVGVLLGAAFGLVRLRGGWQASLFAHWGVAFGLAAAVLLGTR